VLLCNVPAVVCLPPPQSATWTLLELNVKRYQESMRTGTFGGRGGLYRILLGNHGHRAKVLGCSGECKRTVVVIIIIIIIIIVVIIIIIIII
jgi:hypothetical protein